MFSRSGLRFAIARFSKDPYVEQHSARVRPFILNQEYLGPESFFRANPARCRHCGKSLSCPTPRSAPTTIQVVNGPLPCRQAVPPAVLRASPDVNRLRQSAPDQIPALPIANACQREKRPRAHEPPSSTPNPAGPPLPWRRPWPPGWTRGPRTGTGIALHSALPAIEIATSRRNPQAPWRERRIETVITRPRCTLRRTTELPALLAACFTQLLPAYNNTPIKCLSYQTLAAVSWNQPLNLERISTSLPARRPRLNQTARRLEAAGRSGELSSTKPGRAPNRRTS